MSIKCHPMMWKVFSWIFKCHQMSSNVNFRQEMSISSANVKCHQTSKIETFEQETFCRHREYHSREAAMTNKSALIPWRGSRPCVYKIVAVRKLYPDADLLKTCIGSRKDPPPTCSFSTNCWFSLRLIVKHQLFSSRKWFNRSLHLLIR
jgi:hypothetical protein